MSTAITAIEGTGPRRYVYPTDIVAEAGASKSFTSLQPAHASDSVAISPAAHSIVKAGGAGPSPTIAPAAIPTVVATPVSVQTATSTNDAQGSPIGVAA